MIITVLPTGSYHGWGVCGKYLVRELSEKKKVLLIPESLNPNESNDIYDYQLLLSKTAPPDILAAIAAGNPLRFAAPILQPLDNDTWLPALPHVSGSFNLGYTFFENNAISPAAVHNASRSFDLVAAGSSWCEEILRRSGVPRTATLLQGIDPSLFHPYRREKEYFKDRFVIFSGGKFELRKGQDLVVRAVKTLQQRHADVLLVCSWYNAWPDSLATMHQSPYIHFDPPSGDFTSLMNHLLTANGMDSSRTIVLPRMPNMMLSRVYKNSDIGLFPNRCEGGTNLVLMEYMACGKPAVAAFNSGHRDILTAENSIRILQSRPVAVEQTAAGPVIWDDPNLEEIIHHLEWAYHHRDALAGIGDRGARDLSQLTWTHTANRLLELLPNDIV
ncbi:MAG TPA: glycosyltransferase family 4 protein [Patescibacteria group bacterium]|nr:glycosyltransferase family 4 protein [Patescibacteria group bacterium]